MIALLVIGAATLFAYGVRWLVERAPLSTADLAVGAMAGVAGLALTRSALGSRPDAALLLACATALCLQALRRAPGLRRVE